MPYGYREARKPVSNKTVARVLEQALALMNDKGAHWTKGEYVITKRNGEEAFCTVGAVQRVCQSDSYPVGTQSEALRALASAYKPIRPESDEWERIIKWNDKSTTTWADVRRRFERALKKLGA